MSQASQTQWAGQRSSLVMGIASHVLLIVVAVVAILGNVSEKERLNISVRARQRILREHTAAHRAEQLETYALDLLDARARRRARRSPAADLVLEAAK